MLLKDVVINMDYYLDPNRPNLRYGYTTGTCAALASKAATHMLLSGEKVLSVSLKTPKGVVITTDVEDIKIEDNFALCAIKKDSGDDPDVTNGVLVYAQVSRIRQNEIMIEGGVGVGRVTKPGLSCEVGSAAINPGPRNQIKNAVLEIAEEFEASGGFLVTISVPDGVRLAKKTFNPRLGIEGGISILGTSGIVEPMSDSALLESIRLEISVLHSAGNENLLMTPGNYGETFAAQKLGLCGAPMFQCSNFVGDSIELLKKQEISSVLLVGHIGKLVKIAGGMMNTHSKYGDCRLEILSAYAALCGASQTAVIKIMECITTDAALLVLKEYDVYEKTLSLLMKAIEKQLNRVAQPIEIGVVMFAKEYGVLEQTQNADYLIKQLKQKL